MPEARGAPSFRAGRQKDARSVSIPARNRPADIPRGRGKSDLSFRAGSEYFPDFHTLMADELLISGKRHTDGYGSHFAPNQAA